MNNLSEYIKDYISKNFGFHPELKDKNSERVNNLALSSLHYLKKNYVSRLEMYQVHDVVFDKVLKSLQQEKDKIYYDKYVELDEKISGFVRDYSSNFELSSKYLDVCRQVTVKILNMNNYNLDKAIRFEDYRIKQVVSSVASKVLVNSSERRTARPIQNSSNKDTDASLKRKYIRQVVEDEMVKRGLTTNKESLKNDPRVLNYVDKIAKNYQLDYISAKDIMSSEYDDTIRSIMNEKYTDKEKIDIVNKSQVKCNKVVRRRSIKDIPNARLLMGIVGLVTVGALVFSVGSKKADKVKTDDLFTYNDYIYSVDNRNLSSIIDSVIEFDSEEVGFSNYKYSPIAIYKIYSLHHGDNRMADMDIVIKNLAKEAEQMTEDGNYYYDICDSQCFLDYVCRVLSGAGEIEYNDYKKLIGEYVSNMGKKNAYESFNKLEQNKIENLMEKYEDYITLLNSKFVDMYSNTGGKGK